MTHFSFLAAALLISAAAVSAQAADTDPPATAVAPAAIVASPIALAPVRAVQNTHDPNRVICKHEEVIGTRLGGYKACHTWEQWEDIARLNGNVVNAVQGMGSHSNPETNFFKGGAGP